MGAAVSVTYDKADNIIVQHILGDISIQDFDQLEQLTAECVAKMADKSVVRILVDSRSLRQLNIRVRRHAISRMDEKHAGETVCIAFWGATGAERVFLKFLSIVRGRELVRAFATEAEARAWLKAFELPKGLEAAR